MEQLERYTKKPSNIFEVSIVVGQNVRGIDDADRNMRVEELEHVKDDEKDLVVALDKVIYGMMDAGDNWWRTLDKDMARLGYKQSETD